MDRSSMVARRAAVGLIGVLALGGCGVPLQSDPEALPADVIPAPLPVISPSPEAPSASPSPSPAATVSRLRLWFVREDGLVASESSLPADSAPSAVLAALAAGPSVSQVEQGLRTIAIDPLTGLPLLSVPGTVPSPSGPPDPAFPPDAVEALPVVVQLSAAFQSLPPTEQVLLLAQVVLSLTGAGAPTVSFTDDAGTPVAVPLPDGRLLDVPARARDYAPLIVQP